MSEGRLDYEVLENSLHHTFNDRQLLIRSLTHPSFVQSETHSEHNQRLEFLGDAVLGMALAEILFYEMPEEREGVLTRYRSMLVRGGHLANMAREIKLHEFLRMSDGEESNGGRERQSILEDAFESLIGAVYLDSDYSSTLSVIRYLYGDLRVRLNDQSAKHNPKGRLQELLQPTLGNSAIVYEVVEESGPDHEKIFNIAVKISGETWGRGRGASKKAAEEAAARQALEESLSGKKVPPPHQEA